MSVSHFDEIYYLIAAMLFVLSFFILVLGTEVHVNDDQGIWSDIGNYIWGRPKKNVCFYNFLN